MKHEDQFLEEIDAVLDSYIDGSYSDIRSLVRIAAVIGRWRQTQTPTN